MDPRFDKDETPGEALSPDETANAIIDGYIARSGVPLHIEHSDRAFYNPHGAASPYRSFRSTRASANTTAHAFTSSRTAQGMQAASMSQAFIQMSAVFAELELSIIRARVRSGMQNAKAKGKQIGRRKLTKDDIPAIFYRHYPAFMAKQMNVSEFARVWDSELSRDDGFGDGFVDE